MRRYAAICILLSISGITCLLSQENQLNPLERYCGKWRGEVTTTIMNRQGGWDSVRGFLGYHEISNNTIIEKYSITIQHPFDTQEFRDEYRSMGYSDDLIDQMKNLDPFPDRLDISGRVSISEYSSYTHITKSYCEECFGKDLTKETYSGDSIRHVSGYIDLVDNKWHWEYDDISRVEPNCVFIENYEFEEPLTDEGLPFEKKVWGKLCKIERLRDTLYQTIQLNELIITDDHTQRDIIIPASPECPYKVGEIIVAENTQAVFVSENELMLSDGSSIVFKDKNWWENIDLNKLLKQQNQFTEKDMELILDDLYSKTKGQSFKVKSPQSVAGVRGTIFITSVSDNGTSTIKVLEGEVSFSDKNNRNTVLIKENHKSFLLPGGSPSIPEFFNVDTLDHWWK